MFWNTSEFIFTDSKIDTKIQSIWINFTQKYPGLFWGSNDVKSDKLPN